jgi:hypothetical protein
VYPTARVVASYDEADTDEPNNETRGEAKERLRAKTKSHWRVFASDNAADSSVASVDLVLSAEPSTSKRSRSPMATSTARDALRRAMDPTA